MVNTQVFQSIKRSLLPQAVAKNNQHAVAYEFSARHQLAQLACTGCLSETFYANAESQLEQVLQLVKQNDATFAAKAAIYARHSGHMKDMPALIVALLSVKDVTLMKRVFGRVVDNGKMLRNFVQIVRSGTIGRKSLGTSPKKLVQHWLLTANEKQLLAASVGTAPSLADVVKMVHPKPVEAWRGAWFAWLIGKPYDERALPAITGEFEKFKNAVAAKEIIEVPDVPFQMLTSLTLSQGQWAQIARSGSWQMVRQNLNTFARHGVFELEGMTQAIAAKLRDPEAISKARALPYQLMSAFMAAGDATPTEVKDALQDAMEIALENVPEFQGKVVVCPDVSGSMQSPITGSRGEATSSVRCIDVAGLVAAAVLRKNPSARVMPFEVDVVELALNARDSVVTNAKALASVGGGGTNCSAPLARLNAEKAKVELVILVSDNESWVDDRRYGATETLRQWEILKERNPQAKLVCVDIQPYGTTQAMDRKDVLNVGGFSDAVFSVIGNFVKQNSGNNHWINEIEKISLEIQ